MAAKGGIKRRREAQSQRVAVDAPHALRADSRGSIKARVVVISDAKDTVDAQDDPADTSVHRPMLKSMMRMWARSEIMSNQVPECAKGDQQQGAENVGRYGQHSRSAKNAFRDLRRSIGHPQNTSETEFIGKGGFLRAHPILCPVATFEAIAEHEERKCQSMLRAPVDGDIEDRRQGSKNHPARPEPDKIDENTLALGLHGDAAATNRGLFKTKRNSVHPKSTTRDSRTTYTTIKKSDIGEGTIEALWDRVAWSINALEKGIIPMRDRTSSHRGVWGGEGRRRPKAHGPS